MSKDPLYDAWLNMIHRCYNRKHYAYPEYGGRGLKVDRSWMLSFQQFKQDMGPKPGPEYSLDRINNNGDYTPKNCTWSDPHNQALNKRRQKKKRATLSAEEVLDIWNEKGKMLQKHIALKYNINIHTVSSIMTGRHYSSVTGIKQLTRVGRLIARPKLDRFLVAFKQKTIGGNNGKSP